MRTDFYRTRDVFAELDAFRRSVDALFATPGGLHGGHGLTASSRAFYPTLTVTETEEAFTLVGDLPGFTHERLEITVEGRDLRLQGRPADAEEGWTVRRAERPSWTFDRTVRFGADIDADAVSARLEDGVLTITVPKVARTKVTVPVLAS